MQQADLQKIYFSGEKLDLFLPRLRRLRPAVGSTPILAPALCLATSRYQCRSTISILTRSDVAHRPETFRACLTRVQPALTIGEERKPAHRGAGTAALTANLYSSRVPPIPLTFIEILMRLDCFGCV